MLCSHLTFAFAFASTSPSKFKRKRKRQVRPQHNGLSTLSISAGVSVDTWEWVTGPIQSVEASVNANAL